MKLEKCWSWEAFFPSENFLNYYLISSYIRDKRARTQRVGSKRSDTKWLENSSSILTMKVWWMMTVCKNDYFLFYNRRSLVHSQDLDGFRLIDTRRAHIGIERFLVWKVIELAAQSIRSSESPLIIKAWYLIRTIYFSNRKMGSLLNNGIFLDRIVSKSAYGWLKIFGCFLSVD